METQLIRANSQSDVISLPDCWGSVGQVKTSIFLDSGAEVNLIKQSSLSHLPPESFSWETGKSISVSSISNDQLKVIGRVNFDLDVEGQVLRLQALVVEDINFPADVLIGRPSMVTFKIRPMFDEGIVFINNTIVHTHDLHTKVDSVRAVKTRENTGKTDFNFTPKTPNVTKDCHFYFSSPCPARVCRRVTLFKRTLTKVHFRLCPTWLRDNCFDGKGKDFSVTLIIEPSSLNLEGVTAETTLHQTQSGEFFTYLTNVGVAPVKLRKGISILACTILKAPLKEIQMKNFNVRTLNSRNSDSDATTSSNPKTPSLPNISEEQVKIGLNKHTTQLTGLLNKFRDIVALSGEELGRTNLTEHTIALKPGIDPIFVPMYRLPHKHRETVSKLVDEMLKSGVIEPSNSPWNFPLILVPKKDGTWRPVIDYRRLNAVSVPDKYPIPVLADLLYSMNKAKVFSTLDCMSGFWQIPLQESSKPLTAFSTPDGHYQFLVMPFGLHSSPITFTRLMSRIFGHLIGKEVLVYIDDIIVISKDIPSHFSRLQHVLELLQEANLKLKLSKCSFLNTSVDYLGHTVSADGILPNAGKVEAIQQFPVPRTVEQIKSFLGMAGFYRAFIEGFGKIAQPLTKLLRLNVDFVWGTEQEESFRQLQKCLIEAPVLKFPDFDLPFIVHTDASAYAVGAVLMQMHGTKLHPIAYFSKQCSKAQLNYSTTEREALAVVLALKHFRPFIYGYQVTIFTDHQPLVGLFRSTNDYSGRLARWALLVQEFCPTLKYVPGKANVVADALSRVVASVTIFPTLDNDTLISRQRDDPVLGPVISFLERDITSLATKPPIPLKELFMKNNILCREALLGSPGRRVTQVLVPKALVPHCLSLSHDTSHGAHPGADRNIKQLRLKYFWPNMARDIKEYVSQCSVCQQTKGSTQAPLEVLKYPTPTVPWERVSMDLMGPLNITLSGCKYVLVMIDALTRYCEIVAIRNKTAEEVAKHFKERILDRHGAPSVLITDNGTEFNNRLLNALCTFYQVNKVNVCTYHPSSNGLSERLNRKVLHCLRTHVNFNSDVWDEVLSDIQSSINSAYHKTIGDTPFFALYGYDKRVPYDNFISFNPRELNIDRDFTDKLVTTQLIHNRVSEHLAKATDTFTDQANKKTRNNTIVPGHLVMLKSHTRSGPIPKLSAKFRGPFRALQNLSGHKMRLQHILTGDICEEHGDHLKLYVGAEEEVEDEPGECIDPEPVDNLIHSSKLSNNLGGEPNHSYNLRSRGRVNDQK